MKRNVNFGCLTGIILSGLFYVQQVTNAQVTNETGAAWSSPVISRIAVLSIHVRDTLVHDSVFHFLTDKLGLPVEYYPLNYAGRKYAGIYTGNICLEPCGPFSTFRYASNDFKAIFFGVNCETGRSISSLAEDLTKRNIDHIQGRSVRITDTSIIRQNIYFNIGYGNNKKNEDSLRSVMLMKNKNPLGIESIKEIRIGYTGKDCLEKWSDLVKPSVITKNGIWKVNDDQSVRFISSNIREVNAIVFKVRSLKKAKNWLKENQLLGDSYGAETGLDKSKTFGLMFLLSEK